MVVYSSEFVQSQLRRIRLFSGLGSMCVALALASSGASAFLEATAMSFALEAVAGLALLGTSLFFAYAAVLFVSYGPQKRSFLTADLTILRRTNAEVDRALYAIERQGRNPTRSEARALHRLARKIR